MFIWSPSRPAAGALALLLWLSTGVGGLADGATNGLSENLILSTGAGRDGGLWIGADYDGGWFQLEDGHFRHYTWRDGLINAPLKLIHEDRSGVLWIGTSLGLCCLKESNFVAAPWREPHPPVAVQALWEDPTGPLWIGTEQGLTRWEAGRVRHFTTRDGLSDNRVCALYAGKDRNLWVGTAGGGLDRYRDGRFAAYTTRQGLFSDEIFAILEDDRGWLWMSCSRGVFRVRKDNLDNLDRGRADTLVCVAYGKLDGMDWDWNEAGTRRWATYNNVTPGRYRFRVLACNKDGVWAETGATLPIVVLPHVWQTWWLRGLAVLVILGTASGAGRYATRRRLRRKLQLLEQKHAIERERGRIARDIHDDLGSSLTRIMMLGERAEEGLSHHEDVGAHVRKIVTSARHTVQSLDEIVWAVNPDNDSLEALVEYLSHYTNELLEDTNVRCRLEIPLELPPIPLAAEVRHDLFLVFKEALNNILKHAEASEVRVRVAEAAARLEILIEDNGRGFDPSRSAGARNGNGLGNMRERIEHLGGRLSVTSAPARGTRLAITVEMNSSRTGE